MHKKALCLRKTQLHKSRDVKYKTVREIQMCKFIGCRKMFFSEKSVEKLQLTFEFCDQFFVCQLHFVEKDFFVGNSSWIVKIDYKKNRKSTHRI